jgi:hypothetical protein
VASAETSARVNRPASAAIIVRIFSFHREQVLALGATTIDTILTGLRTSGTRYGPLRGACVRAFNGGAVPVRCVYHLQQYGALAHAAPLSAGPAGMS